MTLFQMAALFLAGVAAAGWVNARLLRLPPGVVMLGFGLLASAALVGMQRLAPGLGGVDAAVQAIARLDFPQTVVGYMLAFLLFAGAMQVDLNELRRRRLAVLTLATIGVLASTLLVGGGVWLAARALGLDLAFTWALVFAALISPTDPVAVLATVRHGGVSQGLRAVLQGEALFNDGVGIVVFLALLALARGDGANPAAAASAVLVKAGGGLLLGALLGWAAVQAMKAIDDYAVEVSITLALAVGAYALAEALRLSGAIAVVAAGLVIGASGMRTAMSDVTQRYVRGFWTLVDEILNGLLFFLLGLELVVVPFDPRFIGLWAAAIPLLLAVRLAIVFPWGAYFHFREAEGAASLVLCWGGLRGALSLALALSIPPSPQRPLLLSVTYAVVVFSVVVQGLSFGRLAQWSARLAERRAAQRSGA